MKTNVIKSGKSVPLLVAGALALSIVLVSCGHGGGGYGGGGGSMVLLLPPASFGLLTPANGATAVSTTPQLTWNASLYASGYYVYIKKDTDAAFPAPVSVTTTNYTIPTALAATTLYDWKVTAFNNYGMSTAGAFTFTTGP